jgi:hypothetical protein
LTRIVDDGRRFIVRADELLTAFVELEREVLTVTFYLESIHADWCRGTDDSDHENAIHSNQGK